jgi:hypothetical protein
LRLARLSPLPPLPLPECQSPRSRVSGSTLPPDEESTAWCQGCLVVALPSSLCSAG